MPVRPLFRARVGFLAALAFIACGACSFGHAQAGPTQSRASTAGPSTTSPSSPSPAGDGSRVAAKVAAKVDVDRPGGGSPSVITVTLSPAGTDGAPAGDDCDGTRWVPFEIDFADHGAGPSKQDNEHASLAARVEVRGGGGDVGVLVDAGRGDLPGCTPGKLPAGDSFGTQVIFGGYHVRTSGYVVVRGSASLTGVTLAVTGLRKKPDDIYPPGSWAWQVQRFETGSACPESPSSICVPLGG